MFLNCQNIFRFFIQVGNEQRQFVQKLCHVKRKNRKPEAFDLLIILCWNINQIAMQFTKRFRSCFEREIGRKGHKTGVCCRWSCCSYFKLFCLSRCVKRKLKLMFKLRTFHTCRSFQQEIRTKQTIHILTASFRNLCVGRGAGRGLVPTGFWKFQKKRLIS